MNGCNLYCHPEICCYCPYARQVRIRVATGLGNAHNAGIRAAQGEVLAFTDDDCYPAADYVSQVYAVFASDLSIGYVGGRILRHDPADLALTINESTVERKFPARSYRQSGDVMGANMAFRKSVLLEIDGFDPLFGPGALFNSEDTDAVGRASALGWSGKYCPQVVVRHHHGRKSPAFSQLWKSYSIGRGAYDMKNLLRGEFWWFARSVYGLRRRYRLARGIVMWEQVGKVQYLSICLRQALVKLACPCSEPLMKLSTTDKGGGSAPYDAGFYAAHRDGSLQSAGVIVPILLSYVQPRSVVDIGCGLGTWLKAFRAAGITDVMGYDGDYVDRGALLIEPSRFCPTDLRADGRLQRSFDFTGGRRTPAGTVCPLFRAPPHFRRPVVLFSAAIPGQGGTDHINEQWQDYWRDLFLSEIFILLTSFARPCGVCRKWTFGISKIRFSIAAPPFYPPTPI